jgi:hypothetical protein
MHPPREWKLSVAKCNSKQRVVWRRPLLAKKCLSPPTRRRKTTTYGCFHSEKHVAGASSSAAKGSFCVMRWRMWIQLYIFISFHESNLWIQTVVTWLILPVVICLSQRLSHACLSINSFVLWNCEWLIKSVIIYLIVLTTWITVVILELIHAKKPDLRRVVFIR